MSPEDKAKKLQELRTKVVDELASMSDQLATNDALGYEALIAIARNTGRTELLEKAIEKAHSIEDSAERADVLLELLSEIEGQISDLQAPQEQQPENLKEEQTISSSPMDQPGTLQI